MKKSQDDIVMQETSEGVFKARSQKLFKNPQLLIEFIKRLVNITVKFWNSKDFVRFRYILKKALVILWALLLILRIASLILRPSK